jgi:hypothetical protein
LQLRRAGGALVDLERELEPLGFLRVDREPDAAALRVLREREQARRQLVQAAPTA